MPETIKFSCERCKEDINVDRNNECGVVFFKKKYYHQNCFCALCEEKAANKRSLLSWHEILDNIKTYQSDAIPNINYKFAKDDLNEWIIHHYNVAKLSSRFWSTVEDLEKGICNKTKCKPVSTKLLFETWRWGQKNLDKIHRRNQAAKRGPKTDAERINYDLSIVLSHVGDYLKAKAKHEAEEAERRAREKDKVKIDYNNINSASIKTEGLDDISALLDEF